MAHSETGFRRPETPDIVWIEPGFAIGSRPYESQRAAIAAAGIRVVVALHEPAAGDDEAWLALGVRLIAVPTPDWVEIPLNRYDRVVAVIGGCLDAAVPVLLHCQAGLNRAPTLAAAVLCRRRGLSVETALAAVQRARPAARPTPEQLRSLLSWYGLRCR